MTSHKTFVLGKVSLGVATLAAPVPLITCVTEGRAGWSALLVAVPLAFSLTTLIRHGSDVMDCDDCMNHVVNLIPVSGEYADLADDMDQAA